MTQKAMPKAKPLAKGLLSIVVIQLASSITENLQRNCLII